MPRQTKNYIFVVDGHKRPSRQRRAAGRYRVGARSEKEADKMLRDHLKHIGSPCLLCEDTEGENLPAFPKSHLAKNGEIIKEWP